MQSRTIRKFKLFLAWQDEKEEAWLTRMAQEGFHLKSLGFPGLYIFETGEPRNDVYRLDFLADRTDFKDYIQIFKDAGWERVGKMGGWQYFRTHAAKGETPEIYTDNDSKAAKYRRLISFLIVFLPLYMSFSTLYKGPMAILRALFGLFTLFYVYVLVMIFRRIRKLKRKSG